MIALDGDGMWFHCLKPILTRPSQIDRSFYGQMPIALLCLVAVISQKLPQANEISKKRRLDSLGLTTFAIMLSSFLLLVDFGGRDQVLNIPVVSVLAVVFAVSTISFVLVEHYWAAPPMIPPSLVKHGRLWAYFVAQILLLCAVNTVSQY